MQEQIRQNMNSLPITQLAKNCQIQVEFILELKLTKICCERIFAFVLKKK